MAAEIWSIFILLIQWSTVIKLVNISKYSTYIVWLHYSDCQYTYRWLSRRVRVWADGRGWRRLGRGRRPTDRRHEPRARESAESGVAQVTRGEGREWEPGRRLPGWREPRREWSAVQGAADGRRGRQSPWQKSPRSTVLWGPSAAPSGDVQTPTPQQAPPGTSGTVSGCTLGTRGTRTDALQPVQTNFN